MATMAHVALDTPPEHPLAVAAAGARERVLGERGEFTSFPAWTDGALIAGSPDGLISALRRLEAYAQRIPMDNPNPAQNNLFIVEPLTGNSVLELFATHPPTEKRVAALMAMRGAALAGAA